MRGDDHQIGHLFSSLSPEQHVRADHPLQALYSVRFAEKPGMPGYTLWSLVYVDGQFRLVGKMPMDAG